MAEYFLKNVSSLPDPAADAAALYGIPDRRKRHILKYRNAIDRKLSLGAWRLMEAVLGKYGFSADNVITDANGKPLCEGICFNISHSGEYVLCAVSEAPVGCDIEKAENAPFEITDSVFLPSERKYIAEAQSDEDKSRRFFRLWTMKESYIKMTGEGLGEFLPRIEINPEKRTITRDSTAVKCKLFNVSYGNYEISICEEE